MRFARKNKELRERESEFNEKNLCTTNKNDI